MKRGSLWLCGGLAAALMVAGFAGGALADPRGVWLTVSGKSHVKIDNCIDDEDRLCGKIIWLRRPLGDDGEPRRDIHNEDESLRDRPVLGLRVIWNMEDESDGEWGDGDIYNPTDGETYDAEVEEIDADTLEVSGCVWFLCKTQTWNRVE